MPKWNHTQMVDDWLTVLTSWQGDSLWTSYQSHSTYVQFLFQQNNKLSRVKQIVKTTCSMLIPETQGYGLAPCWFQPYGENDAVVDVGLGELITSNSLPYSQFQANSVPLSDHCSREKAVLPIQWLPGSMSWVVKTNGANWHCREEKTGQSIMAYTGTGSDDGDFAGLWSRVWHCTLRSLGNHVMP